MCGSSWQLAAAGEATHPVARGRGTFGVTGVGRAIAAVRAGGLTRAQSTEAEERPQGPNRWEKGSGKGYWTCRILADRALNASGVRGVGHSPISSTKQTRPVQFPPSASEGRDPALWEKPTIPWKVSTHRTAVLAMVRGELHCRTLWTLLCSRSVSQPSVSRTPAHTENPGCTEIP